ncbi:hypothetical protein [Staphylococcus lugdunensis]|uniref:hypothetical protein n=2 Tax=Staphylococcus lugdunensis TaxID=28035 RepID=UPI001F4C75A8|nr:hypothetical protein [Staphylococcus lugdunensis]MCH8679259.1 hypothetical protein [Staphylococcus lugdunensis]MCI2826188.1 hypothetical protein [Staphylococcus lugdunensis]MCI2836504.1 hypothetical protein [Staphylococcus lugdunensis]MCM3466913.1 hypothetical protein [Staphylococcus lugdunensis]MDU4449428.1 hypothetical protein [Staphylococcus lugdunensis]
MKRAVNTVLCASLILGGCASMNKEQMKDIPKTVSVKDYDGKYIGGHKERNKIFLKKYKAEAEKKYKEYVKEVFGLDCKINLVKAYTNSYGFGEKNQSDGLVVVGTVKYDVPFQLRLIFAESNGKIVITTFTPGHENETSAAVAAMMYKYYEYDIEQARLKFKSEVEKNGYYAMNEQLEKKQEFNGVTKQYLNVNTDSIDDLNKFKKEFKPVMKLKGAEFNQQMENLIGKYPYIKKGMEYDFIAYYNKKTSDNVNRYSWNIQIPTNDTMKKLPGTKMMYFYKDGVSPSKLGEDGKLKRQTNDISMDGGNWDKYKNEKN